MKLLWPVAAFLLLAPVAATVGPASDASITDVGIYQDQARALSQGLFPYAGFESEYPPLSLIPVGLAELFGDYELGFGLLMLLAGAALVFLTGMLGGSRSAWILAIGAPLAIGASLRTHYDLVPTAVAIGGLAAVVRGYPRAGMAVLGLGAMTKFWPALFLPLVAIWLWRRDEGRKALQGLAWAAVVMLAVSLPFLVEGGYTRVFTFHLERGVQIESTPASLLFAFGGSEVNGIPANPSPYKSQGLEGGSAGIVAAVFAALQVAALVWIFLKTRGGTRDLVVACFVALLAFVALGKVFSPQYAIWLAPFAAIAWAWGHRWMAGLTALGIVLTQVEFPANYWDLVAADPYAITLVAVRNLALVGALALGLSAMASGVTARTAAGAARSPSPPAHPPPRGSAPR